MICNRKSLIAFVVACLVSGSLVAQSPRMAPDTLVPQGDDKSHGKWCSGDLLLDQAPNRSFSLWSEATCLDCSDGAGQFLADDLLLANDSLVTEVVVWGWYFPLNTPPVSETWTVIIHQDGSNEVGNVPGNILSTQVISDFSRIATGESANVLGVDVDEYRWQLKLPEPVRLATAGTFYWVELIHDSPDLPNHASVGFGDFDGGRSASGFALDLNLPDSDWETRENDDEMAMQVCGVRSEWNGLMVPGYELDLSTPGGPTTFLAVRNTSDSAVDIDVAYYGEDLEAGPLRVDAINLAPRQTYTHNLRANPNGLDPDANGIASGFVMVTQANGDGAKNLTGDVLRVDFANDFATGERLLGFDDFCPRQEIRYVDFGSGSEFNVVLRDPPASGPTMSVAVLDEAGNQLSQVDIFDRQQVQRIPIGNLIANQSFGSLVFDFSASQGGVVTARYSAFGRFSTELRGACR